MVKFYASAKLAVDTKNDLKFIFQCGIGVFHKLNEKKCYALSWSQEKHKQHQFFVKILLKLPTKKISRNHTSKISKEKLFPLWAVPIEWKIIFIALSDLHWMLLFLLRTYVTCAMGATLMLRWSMEKKHLICQSLQLFMIITVFVNIKKVSHLPSQLGIFGFHVYG